MKIESITISNFRSIRYETINIRDNCLILLGKNEAGKSNVLKAIAALFGEYKLTSKDKRKRIANEKINNYFIREKFTYTDDDISKFQDTILKKHPTVKDIDLIKDIPINEYIRLSLDHIYYQIDIEDNATAKFVYEPENKGDDAREVLIYQNSNSNSTKTGSKKIELDEWLSEAVQAEYNTNPYKCLFWHYNDDLLLPSSVDRNQFINAPSRYKALENLFIMCERGNIAEEFKEAEEEDGDYENLLEQVSSEATDTFRTIWKDFNDTSIVLSSDGDNIRIKIVNKAKYSFEDRSDGFKKFISILLLLSTQARAHKIGERNFILIDEPDQSLYPTSATYLRDELLKISSESHARVIYTTHSQYMIDSNWLERHFIVEKKDDITTIRQETGIAQYADDELLRRAIGSSIFECIKEVNIIFEGWTDKELFLKYYSATGLNNIKNIGITFLHGISGVEALVSLMIVANKKFIIVADSDKTSRSKKKDFEKSFPDHKDCWLEYNIIDNNIQTLEDFIEYTMIENVIKEMGYTDVQYNKDDNAIVNIERCIKEKEKRQECKQRIVRMIRKENIKEAYSDFVKKLESKLTELQKPQ